MIKEIAFYLIGLAIISIFGFFCKSGYLFVGIFMSTYIIYLIVSFSFGGEKEEEQEDTDEDGTNKVGTI